MKNLLIYIAINHKLDSVHEDLLRIQIDNSYRLGWSRDDIMLVTNFPCEYNGVKTMLVGDENWCGHFNPASKINTIRTLFREGVFQEKELYWFHDFDAYENFPIEGDNLDVELKKVDVGFTDYAYRGKWNTGSFFFKKEARDIFDLLGTVMYKIWAGEEAALLEITKRDLGGFNKPKRWKRIHNTYNVGGSDKGFRAFWEITWDKIKDRMPVRVLHFHPGFEEGRYLRGMATDKELGIRLMTDGLQEVFAHHGWKP